MSIEPNQGDTSQNRKPEGQNPFGGFRKRTYRFQEFVRHLGGLLPRIPGIYAVWMKKRMDPLFREEIMVAVARTNACRFCNFVHGQWALAEGLSEQTNIHP